MWWPSPEAIESLFVEDAENGFILSAPDNTECGAWLQYWNQTEEHQKIFEEAFVEMLRSYLNKLDNENGKTEAISDQQSGDRAEA
jgi:hypothetical protein